ncbi:MAG: histidine kinase [Nitrospira bacterium SG8_3]|nr:MAG: histidine kinase [Nitrospira bacterium SG8_3]
MKVLLVDDEEKFVSRLAERLEIRGFEADWTTTSDGALSKAENEEYDIAVLDVKMPRLSGIDLKKGLEKLVPKMKFIFVSGHGSEEDYDIGIREGAFYLTKPFKIETLVERIKEALNL